jgi:hypothetical protein
MSNKIKIKNTIDFFEENTIQGYTLYHPLCRIKQKLKRVESIY